MMGLNLWCLWETSLLNTMVRAVHVSLYAAGKTLSVFTTDGVVCRLDVLRAMNSSLHLSCFTEEKSQCNGVFTGIFLYLCHPFVYGDDTMCPETCLPFTGDLHNKIYIWLNWLIWRHFNPVKSCETPKKLWTLDWLSPAAVMLRRRRYMCIKSSSSPTILPPEALYANWKQNTSVVVFTVFGATMLLGVWPIHHALAPPGTGGCEQCAGGSRISVTGGARRMAVCPGGGGGRVGWGG